MTLTQENGYFDKSELVDAEFISETKMKQDFIEILTSGSFFSESSIMAIDNWSIDLAVEQLRSRYAERLDKPYGFRFMTKERGPNDLDSKVSKRSGIYFFPGRVSTYDEVVARRDARDSILISIMSSNGFDRVICVKGGMTLPVTEWDTLLGLQHSL